MGGEGVSVTPSLMFHLRAERRDRLHPISAVGHGIDMFLLGLFCHHICRSVFCILIVFLCNAMSMASVNVTIV